MVVMMMALEVGVMKIRRNGGGGLVICSFGENIDAWENKGGSFGHCLLSALNMSAPEAMSPARRWKTTAAPQRRIVQAFRSGDRRNPNASKCIRQGTVESAYRQRSSTGGIDSKLTYTVAP